MGRLFGLQRIDAHHEQGFLSPVDPVSEDEASVHLLRRCSSVSA